MLRPLTASERALLDFLLTRNVPGVAELRMQAQDVHTGGLSCTCGCPSFSLHPDRSRAPAAVSQRMPTDAHGTDPEGNRIGVLLFVEAGYLSEVEIYAVEESVSARLPDPASLELSEWSPGDGSGRRHLLNP